MDAGDSVLAIVSIARPERNDGEVGHRQLVWLERTLVRYKKKVKVVVLHHHLIQVPDTGRDNIPVVDAGYTLRGLLHAKVGVVLAGHRHRPWRWSLEETRIIHAGTVSSERLRGFCAHSYNTIQVTGSSIQARLKVVGGKYLDFDEVVKGHVGLPTFHP
jgi:3',5'-cyclic-AMP phosphodiesterase